MSDDVRPGSWIASLDQMAAAAIDFAKIMARYYAALIEAEVPMPVATALAISYQETLMKGVLDSDGEEEQSDG